MMFIARNQNDRKNEKRRMKSFPENAGRLEKYFNYEMQDGSYMHLEFADDRITEETLQEYREYEACLEKYYSAPVRTVVICSSNVKSIKTELKNGENIYRIQTINMGEKDGDQILGELETLKEQGEKIGEERLVPLALTPLMSGKTSMEERFVRALDLLHSEEAGIEKEARTGMESMIYALAEKLLDRDTFDRVKKKIDMEFLQEMLAEDGEQDKMQREYMEGIRKGEVIKLVSQVRKKMLRGLEEDQIAEMLEEEFSVIQKICGILRAEGMAASDEEIWREYMEIR